MPSPFLIYSVRDVETALGNATLHEGYDANRKFYDGDHWQEGAQWPDYWGGTIADAEYLIRQYRTFTSKNILAELCDRVISAIAGQEITWRLTVARGLADGEEPTAEEQLLIAEGEAALTNWWDARGMRSLLRDALLTGLLSGRVVFRLYVPSGLVDEQGTIRALNLAAALDMLYANPVPEPSVCAAITDPATKQQAGVFVYDNVQQQRIIELWYHETLGERTVTIRREVSLNTEQVDVFAFDALPIFDADVPLLVTPQLRQMQRAFNVSLTRMAENTDSASSAERVITNAQAPGTITTNADGSQTFTPDAFQTGSRVINYVTGIPIYGDTNDPNKITGYAQPNYIRLDPISPSTYVETQESLYRAMLQEAQQLYALISGDASPSGESRIQAMTDFINSVLMYKDAVEQLTRWLLMTSLKMAATFAGVAGRYDSLRADAQCRLYVGAVTSTEREQNRLDVEAGLMSAQTAMERNGIEDVDAEQQKINEAREQRVVAEQAGTLTGLRAMGLAQEAQQATAQTNGVAA